MHDIDRYGIGGVVSQVLKNQGDRPLHLSYDIDAVDPIEAPSTGTVVRGGLSDIQGKPTLLPKQSVILVI